MPSPTEDKPFAFGTSGDGASAENGHSAEMSEAVGERAKHHRVPHTAKRSRTRADRGVAHQDVASGCGVDGTVGDGDAIRVSPDESFADHLSGAGSGDDAVSMTSVELAGDEQPVL
jgi:hypothetical protein